MKILRDVHTTRLERIGITIALFLLFLATKDSPAALIVNVVAFVFVMIFLWRDAANPSRRAEVEAPPLIGQIRDVSKEVFLQTPEVVRVPLERGLAENIRKLEEIALKLQTYADDPSVVSSSRKEQAAMKFAKLLTDIAEAHAKYTHLTGRVLLSQVLKREEPSAPAASHPEPNT